MASILDNLRDNRGIKILDTQLNSTSAMAGAYDVLYHTNGYIYVAFARNDLSYPLVNGLRDIWMSRSADGGVTFETPVRITSGSNTWNDNPAMVQIYPGEIDSPIGLVFSKSVTWQDRGTFSNEYSYPYRGLIGPELTIESSFDIITGYSYYTGGLTLVKGKNSFQLYAISNETTELNVQFRVYSNPIVTENAADGFLNNAWTATSTWSQDSIGDGYKVRSLKVRSLSNGDLAFIGAIETAATGLQYLCNLGVRFSSDDGVTWSPMQLLTDFTGTPAIDLVGLTCVTSADIAEINPNQLAIVYQEGTPTQLFYGNSTPANLEVDHYAVEYHAGKDALFMAGLSGVYVYDCASQTYLFHFTTSSTPPIWSESVQSISLSPDGKYLAVGSSSYYGAPGGLDVIDISDPTPANWTIVASIRNTTTPNLNALGIYYVEFIDNVRLVYTVDTGSVNYVFGGILNVETLSIIPLESPSQYHKSGEYRSTVTIDRTNNVLYSASNTYRMFWKNNLTDGSLDYSYTSSIYYDDIFIDPVNDEIIVIGSTTLQRFTDTGTEFNLLETISTTTNPRIPNTITGESPTPLGTGGIALPVDKGALWYDFHSQKITGPFIAARTPDVLGYDPGVLYNSATKLIKNNEWLLTRADLYLHFQKVSQTGKLRWGLFSYDPVAKTIDTDSDNFHLFCNTDWVDANDAVHLVKPRICAAPNENVFLTAFRYYPQNTGMALVTGVMNREHIKLGLKASIKKRLDSPLTVQGRIKQEVGQSLAIKASMVFAQCIKLRACIIPEQHQGMGMMASVLNKKRSNWECSFSVIFSGMKQSLRLQFTANTGYTGLRTFTAQGRVVKVSRKRFTAHYIVPANPISGAFIFDAVNLSFQNVITMKAHLVSNR